MATATTPRTDASNDAPPGYRPVDLPGLGDRRWIHEVTGLAVDIMRFARQHSVESTGTPDWYEHRLVIRPDGPDGGGRAVDKTDDPDYAIPMAAQWMREHPEGVCDVEVR